MTALFDDDDLTVRLVKDLREGRRVEASARLLHDRFVVLVARFFRRKGVPPASIDDLSQETFLRVFRGIDGFRDGHKEAFSAWTLQIARNVFKNWLRTAQAQKREGAEVPLVTDLQSGYRGVLEESLLDGEPDPLLRLTEREEKATLRAAIERLSEQRRRACEMRYLHGLKYREIAVEMSISIETVKAHLHQARALLEAALRSPVGDSPDSDPEKGRP
jgi:RNA polymerase sigma-70 factor (ECF subfamily)